MLQGSLLNNVFIANTPIRKNLKSRPFMRLGESDLSRLKVATAALKYHKLKAEGRWEV
jgi:hypothetical protein